MNDATNKERTRRRKRQRENAYAMARALGKDPSTMRKAWDELDRISDPKGND